MPVQWGHSQQQGCCLLRRGCRRLLGNLQAPAQQARWACCSDHHGCCHYEALCASDQTTGLVPCWAHHRPGERQPGSSHWGTQLQRGSCWGSDDVPAQPGCRCAAAPAPATLLQGTAVRLFSAAGLLTARHGAQAWHQRPSISVAHPTGNGDMCNEGAAKHNDVLHL